MLYYPLSDMICMKCINMSEHIHPMHHQHYTQSHKNLDILAKSGSKNIHFALSDHMSVHLLCDRNFVRCFHPVAHPLQCNKWLNWIY